MLWAVMDVQQALSDLTEISSQIQAAVVRRGGAVITLGLLDLAVVRRPGSSGGAWPCRSR